MKRLLSIRRTVMLFVAVLACLLFSQAGDYQIELIRGQIIFYGSIEL